MSASGNSRVVPIVPQTNRQFLEMLAGDQWEHVLVASYIGDPENPNLDRSSWQAAPAGRCLGEPNFDAGNTYFCPMLFQPGTWRRQGLDNALRLLAITVDDVGPSQKVDEAAVTSLLGCGPTYLIETSPGNFQGGWKTTGMTDMAWVKGMLAQLDMLLGGTADNLTNPIAWRRLPVGRNMKGSLGLGPQGWRVRTKLVRPDRSLDMLDFAGLTQLGTITSMTTLNRGTGDAARPDAQVLAADPVYQALEAGGRIVGEKITSDKFWAVTIRCPWIAEHGPARPETGAEYVPDTPGQRRWFHCFHCERKGRDTGAFMAELDVALRAEGQKIVASFEFDAVDPASCLGQVAIDPWPGINGVTLWAPWDEPPFPVFAGGVMAPEIEDTMAALSERGGMDFGALAAAFVTAASGAADKRARLISYTWASWASPPILWLALVAESGQLKTPTLEHALRALKREHHRRFTAHAQAVKAWQLQGNKAIPRPAEPGHVVVNDVTVEKLQMLLEDNPRGLLYVRDELAGWLEFGRYSQSGGDSNRGFLLEAYEAGSYTVSRVKRPTVFIPNCGLAVIGGIQQARLAGMKGLTDDGLLQRFGIVQMERGTPTAHALTQLPPDTAAIDEVLERMVRFVPLGDYRTDPAGAVVIEATQRLGARLSQGYEYGPGFRGFVNKLHGTHARVALVLHMMEDPDELVVPVHTVERAWTYTRFLLEHAQRFYGGMPGAGLDVTRGIASWVLRKGEARITARDLMRGVAACRGKTLREIQDQVAVLVGADWLRPESAYPDNRAWKAHPGLKVMFAARVKLEEERVSQIMEDMNWQGKRR